MKYFLSFLVVLTSYMSLAQTSALEIREIMKGENFVGFLPEQIEWSVDSRQVYFTWNPDQDTLRSLYKVNAESRQVSRVSFAEQKQRPESGQYNEDHSLMVYEKSGDIFLYNTGSGALTRITNTLQRESNPDFTGGGRFVSFSADGNLYAWEIASGSTQQLTNFISGNEKKDKKLPEQQQWLEDDQLEHFEILLKRKNQSELARTRRDSLEEKRPLVIYTGDKAVFSTAISPDMKFITYSLRINAKDERTEVPDYVTQSGYTDHSMARAKVGSPQNTYESYIYDIARDTTYQITTDQIEGIYDKPEFLKDYADGEFNPNYEKPREVIIHGPVYSPSGTPVVVIRSQDNKDRWIMQLDLATGGLVLLDRQHDEAWVGGPGIGSWNFSSGNIGWIDDRTLWFQSEETGYSHLYSMDVSSKRKKALTSGEFEIRSARLSRDRKTFFIESNRESPHQRHFYSMPSKGGKLTRITEGTGNFDVSLSPDERFLAIRYSYSNKPWELYLMENSAGATMHQITASTTDQFKAYDWRDPEIVRFKAQDGADVPARLYTPENPNGAAVVFVHGAGYLQNVHQWWSSYYREYMFHNYLTDLGYTVLDIDFRGSDGYGRDWRTGIYRFMGGKDLSDQVDGAKFLVENHGVDAGRIGIYGGSYGGFITLMALFTAPDVFQSGAALRSVTDWAHYNHGYTSNILNTPVEDSIAYYRSSPIYHAAGLKNKLVMLHGMLDDNVQFQDVVRLSQRLIELEKTNWDLAVFPMERHGFVESSSWADEYRRIYELFSQTLNIQN